ncbi:GPI inositol-deacylase [Lysobacter sp. S4-A87]|uniref:esterase/lipase family protein n=1 Tax=Lysobacter sp. S4-A87 TaxID=2925843 RepID=UPI001F53537F|nr:alpha/beta fold hydrolase [Lysobacter sp. S4-A87]UNK48711.1 GPI inositol-deacylase [Lysobacter sp. S4-A87]
MKHLFARKIELALPALLVMVVLGVALLVVTALWEPEVSTGPMTPAGYIALKRGDTITTGRLSVATRETFNVTGLAKGPCASVSRACIDALVASPGISEEKRQSALAELWIAHAMAMDSSAMNSSAMNSSTDAGNAALLDSWMEAARHSYAYLFLTERASSDRAFDERQTQVRDYYNLATENAARILFALARHTPRSGTGDHMTLGAWNVQVDMAGIRFPGNARRPSELIPASSLSFAGLRSIYRRDGLGAELLAVTPTSPRSVGNAMPPLKFGSTRLQPSQWGKGVWGEMNSPVISVLTRFPGKDLAQVLATHDATLTLLDPYRHSAVNLQGQSVPLAANFTAGYGWWLARSGFYQQSLDSLLGRANGIDRPHLYMIQPFDPDRRIILMLHGLASSPEGWANVANELMGDEELRQNFQIWQVYYPTNVPLVFNHYAIRQTLQSALHHFDPDGTSVASHDMVLVGHSMGGMMARLMVSSSGDALVQMVRDDHDLDDAELKRVLASVRPALVFDPIPNAGRVIFLATPHRGTHAAGSWWARTLSAPLRLPAELTGGVRQLLDAPGPANRRKRKDLANSVRNLDAASPFIRAVAQMPISPAVQCHSIIARRNGNGPLQASTDGLVPYWSSHLPSASSEVAVISDHSVQKDAASIIELRRILHEDIRQHARL